MVKEPQWFCSRGADESCCPRGEPVYPGRRWQTAPLRDGRPDPTTHLCDPVTHYVFCNTPETAECQVQMCASTFHCKQMILCPLLKTEICKLFVCTCTIGVNVSGKAALMMAFLVVPTKSSPGFPSAKARTGPNASPTWIHAHSTDRKKAHMFLLKASHTIYRTR